MLNFHLQKIFMCILETFDHFTQTAQLQCHHKVEHLASF